MKLYDFHDYHNSLMEFADSYDFDYSLIELFEFHDFHDSHMEFQDFNVLFDSKV